MSRWRRYVLFAAFGSCLLGLSMIHQALDSPTLPRLPQFPQRPPALAAQSPHTGAATARPAIPAIPTVPARTVPAMAAPGAHPVRLKIPKIGVDAPFTSVDLGADGVLNAPPSDYTNLVGWWQGGTVPGNQGPAIVLGHVDTRTAPAVFWNLSALPAGSTVDITRDDGVTTTFTVDSAEEFPKDQFPDDRVYGKTADAQLRLITCGGSYDKGKREYTGNVVVFAHLTGLRGT